MTERGSPTAESTLGNAGTHGRRRRAAFTLRDIRLWTGLAIALFVAMHLTNHGIGLLGFHAMESARPWIMAVWHSVPGQILLYGALLTHLSLGVYSLLKRRHFRAPAWELTQLFLGIAIPYFLLKHILATRGTRVILEQDFGYAFEMQQIWSDPVAGPLTMAAMVLIIWGHLVVGLHFWLRLKSWYGALRGPMAILAVLIPAAAIVSLMQNGPAAADAWRAEHCSGALDCRSDFQTVFTGSTVAAGTNAPDPRRAEIHEALKQWIGPGFLAFVLIALFLRHAGRLVLSGPRVAVTYTPKPTVKAASDMTVLEVSRFYGLPHASVCGGRARCTTCRVRVDSCMESLPPPNADEARALARINAPPGVRLACQLRPPADISLSPLINPRGPAPADTDFGAERFLTVLFVDLRGSTQLAERRFPFDVVFLMNQFLREMTVAVETHNGHYSNFTGDGMMAIFGLNSAPEVGARDALACAEDMLRRLTMLNTTLAHDLEEPLRFGIGIHSGDAVVGRMGPPRTPVLTALGDTVNTAARLESATKDLNAALVVSETTADLAGWEAGQVSFVSLKGKSQALPVRYLEPEQSAQAD